MTETIVFFFIFPLIFAGISVLAIWIRRNKRYDVMFNINWESMAKKDRLQLMHIITSAVFVFGLISMFYFPVIYATSVAPEIALAFYFGFAAVLALIVIISISRYSKWDL